MKYHDIDHTAVFMLHQWSFYAVCHLLMKKCAVSVQDTNMMLFFKTHSAGNFKFKIIFFSVVSLLERLMKKELTVKCSNESRHNLVLYETESTFTLSCF